MKKALLYTLLFLSLKVSAEVERFAMLLSGDFTKDYCTISPTFSTKNDIDIENQQRDIDLLGYVSIGWQQFDLMCSEGLYDVYIGNPDGDYSEIGDNILGFFNALVVGSENVSHEGDTRTVNVPASMVNPYYYTGANFENNVGSTLNFRLVLKAKPGDDDWSNLGDTFTYTFTPIITIER